jgi:hypothetical protein
MSKTKTYKYLYKMMKALYYRGACGKSLYRLDTSTKKYDGMNVYLDDTTIPDSNESSALLFFKVDMNHTRFKSCISYIIECDDYVAHYVDRQDYTKCVVILKLPSFFYRAKLRLLESKYSEMFSNNINELQNPIVAIEYSNYEKEYSVMTKDEKYFNTHILSLVSNLPEEEIEKIKQNEYDSRINKSIEVLNA